MTALAPEAKEENGNGEDVVMQDLSELSDTSEVPSDTISSKSRKGSKSKPLTHAKEREAARAKQASQKQAAAEVRRLEEEIGKLEKRLEGIERDFRKLLGAVRVKAIGRDRFYNRIWWFDGTGSASLIGSGGIALYGTGRIFIQGPSEFDLQYLQRREKEENEDIDARRREDEGEEGVLGPGDWGVYNELEEVCLHLTIRCDQSSNKL